MSVITFRTASAALAATLALGAAAVPPPALAQTDLAAAKAQVDAAKSRGVVGEQGDGYLGFVTDSSDAGLKAAVDAINAGRGAAYRAVAARTGVTEANAGAAAFQQLFARMPAGGWYRPNGGAWKQK